jgi:hypothetical protein
MLRQRREAATKVAKVLHATEDAVDEAIVQASALAGTMPAARREAGLSAVVGQAAMDHVVTAMAALAEARRALVAAHHALSDVQGQIGLGALNFGVTDKPDYPESKETHWARLRAA